MNLVLKIYFLLTLVLQCLLLTVAILKDAFLDSQNSDLLYAPLFLMDISKSFTTLSLWNLTPAPYFFPDLLLYYPFKSLDIGISLFFYNFIFSTICFFFLWRILNHFYTAYFFIFFLGFVFLYTGKLFYFFAPTHHSSLYLFGFYLVFVTKNSLKNREFSGEILASNRASSHSKNPLKNKSYLYLSNHAHFGLLGIGFLFGTSDIQILLQILLPFFIFEIISVSWNTNKFKEKLFFYFMLCTAVLLGNLFLNHLHHLKILRIPQVPIFKTWIFLLKQGLIWKNLAISLVGFFQEIKEFYFFYLFLFLGYGLLFLVRQSFQFLMPYAKSLWVSFLLSVLVIFFFQGSFGIWMGYRYIWFYYLFPTLYLVLEFSLYIRETLFQKEDELSPGAPRRTLFFFWGMGFFSFLVLSLEIYSFAPELQRFGTFYLSQSTAYPATSPRSLRPKTLKIRPDFIQCLTNLQTIHALSHGVSDYWMSKYILYFSQNQIVTHQVSSDLNTYSWINNSSIQEEKEEFSFLIPQNLPKSLLLERLGDPTQIEICDAKEIWIYKSKFSYSQLHAGQMERKQ